VEVTSELEVFPGLKRGRRNSYEINHYFPPGYRAHRREILITSIVRCRRDNTITFAGKGEYFAVIKSLTFADRSPVRLHRDLFPKT
jgi:hypothetical protein